MPRTHLTTPATRGLDRLNFFIAGEQIGFGPFIAVYLTARQWSQGEIGFALSLGTITAMISQVPAGLLVLAAGAMGLLGSCVSEQAVFLLTAVLCVPALAARHSSMRRRSRRGGRRPHGAPDGRRCWCCSLTEGC